MASKFKGQGGKRTKKSSATHQAAKRKRSTEPEETEEKGEKAEEETSDAAKKKQGSGSVCKRRIVLVGKTGVGKSSAGNTILGREAFDSELTPSSVTSECKKEEGEVEGRQVAVVDTPGLFDTNLSNEDIWRRIKMCVGMSCPGPHAFLVILQLGRFTEEERETVKMIQDSFGEDASKYTMVLFTHGDRLKKQTIEEFVSKSKELQDIITKCHGRYHVFDNLANKPSQSSQLLDKIDKMIQDNGGTHYTTEMFVKAEEAIEKEKERILKENEAERNKELKELETKYTGQILKMQQEFMKKMHEAEARAQAEKKNEIHHHHHHNHHNHHHHHHHHHNKCVVS